MTLTLYIVRRFLSNLLRVQIGLFILILLINATEQLRIFQSYEMSLSTMVWLVLMTIPEVLFKTFPLVIMLTSLFTFMGLSRSSELVIVRASGVSILKILTGPILASVLMGVLMVAFFNPIVAATIRKADDIRASFLNKPTSQLSVSEDGIWLRQANETSQFVIHAATSNSDGTILYRVGFHEFTPDNVLIRRIEAARAQLLDGEWKLSRAKQWRFLDRNLQETSDIGQFDDLRIPTDLTSDKIIESFVSPERMSIWKIPAFVRQLDQSGFSTVRHRLFFQAQLSVPLMLAGMVMLGAVFAVRPSRFGQAGVLALVAVLSGFVLFALKNVAESLGEAQEVPVMMAAWAPPVAILLMTLAMILHFEDG